MLNYEKSLSCKNYSINNTPVFFPHSLYPSQEKMIDSILQALKTNSNGLFHSPTGTGKTLCFLVSVLSYIESLEEKEVTFIYCTRTHSQMNSIVKELKKTCYEPKMALLCSRDIFCINEELSQLNSELKNIKCGEIKEECIYNQNLTTALDIHAKPLLMDIEDLGEFAKEKKICPFYLCHDLKNDAKLVISTYNYILNPRIRKMSRTNLKNAVILFDEAHNIEEICENYLTFSFKLSFFEKVKETLQFIFDSSENIQFVKRLEAVFREIDCFTQKIEKISKDKKFLQFGGEEIKQIIDEAFQNSLLILSDQEPVECLQKNKEKTLIFLKFKSILWKISYLQKKLTNNEKEEASHFFWTLEKKIGKKSNAVETKISQFMFDPSIIFKSLIKEGPKCIFLTSGTLAPFNEYEARLGIKFNITLESAHAINSAENVVASILYKGISNKILFDFSKISRESPNKREMMVDLGESLLRLIKIIPNGKLIFFTSYGYMQDMIFFWKSNEGNHIYQRFEEITQIFIETKLKKHGEKKPLFIQKKQNKFYETFCEEANKEQGAVLFGVLRGKGSEGIDFTDKSARAVFIVGIPFGPYKEPKINLKMKYLDKIQEKSSENKISGEEWYHLQAIKCINQGIGRVIRHKHDYGVLCLIDNRYERSLPTKNISLWARNVLKRNDFLDFEKKVTKFFNDKNQMNSNLIKICEHDQQIIEKMDLFLETELQENKKEKENKSENENENHGSNINDELIDFLDKNIEKF